jgi:chromosome partitioning protein
VKPEFLATIGLPLLAKSLEEFKASEYNHKVEFAGIVFNDSDPQHIRPEHNSSRRDVRKLAKKYGWNVFDSECRHSRSYAAGARNGKAIFNTKHARKTVKAEFRKFGDEFLARIGL